MERASIFAEYVWFIIMPSIASGIRVDNLLQICWKTKGYFSKCQAMQLIRVTLLGLWNHTNSINNGSGCTVKGAICAQGSRAWQEGCREQRGNDRHRSSWWPGLYSPTWRSYALYPDTLDPGKCQNLCAKWDSSKSGNFAEAPNLIFF